MTASSFFPTTAKVAEPKARAPRPRTETVLPAVGGPVRVPVRPAETLSPQWADTPAARFDAEHPGLVGFLLQQRWSDFAQSLAQQIIAKGRLSERQLAAALSMRAKIEAKRRVSA